MAGGGADLPLGSIHVLWGAGSFSGWSDGELLARFLAGRDPTAEAAFAALVSRHGPMVLKVCRQLLGDEHVVEDAFQATFVVLARKARSVRHPEALRRWLYGVAVRAARKARSIEQREARRARRIDPEELAEAVGDDRPLDLGLIRRETDELLHQELGRLPEKYRAPVILCHLEGLTHDEAARRLGWPAGTVSVRLMRARDLLRQRLVRRGVAPAAAVSAALWADSATAAAVPTGLIEATTRSVMQIVIGRGPVASATAASLTKAVLRDLGLARLRAGVSLLAAVVVGVATGASGTYWLSPDPERELEARALALALASPYNPDPPHPPPPVPASAPNRAPHAPLRPSPAPGYGLVFFQRPGASLLRQRITWGLSVGIWGTEALGEADVDQAQNGETVITSSVRVTPGAEGILECRPVLFDADQRRYLPAPERSTLATSVFGHTIAIDRFRIGRDILPFEAIAAVGVERMKPETVRLASRGLGERTARRITAAPARVPVDAIEAGPGCAWVLPPRPVGLGDWTDSASGPGGGVACDVSTTGAGLLTIQLAYRSSTRASVSVLGEPRVYEYRPVLIDAAGRHDVPAASQGSIGENSSGNRRIPGDWSDMAMVRYEVPADRWRGRSRDGLTPQAVVQIGVERLSPKTLREARVASYVAYIQRQEYGLDRRDRELQANTPENARLTQYARYRLGADLGAYEILRTHLGKPARTTESLRPARITQFLWLMREAEHQWGSRFEAMMQTPYLVAYDLVRRQTGGSR
jgi:RNA polymerase sigma factor (sigma-70 family)